MTIYCCRSKLKVLLAKSPAGTLLPVCVDGGFTLHKVVAAVMKVSTNHKLLLMVFKYLTKKD